MSDAPAETTNDDQLPDSPVHQLQIPQSSKQLPPFDCHGAMRRLGCNPTSMFSVIDEVDNLLPAGPIVVHSERAGGGARLCS
jgi:hypothetical protein